MATKGTKTYRIVGPKDPNDRTASVKTGDISVRIGEEFEGTPEQYEAVSLRFVVEEVGNEVKKSETVVKPVPMPDATELLKGGDK